MVTGMTDEEFAKMVNHGRKSRMVAVMIAIYDHPKDFPECYVARVHFIGNGRHWPSPELFIARATLDEVRVAIPAGMRWMNRQPTDDSCIVGTYM
ncbi:MAG: hypothetical protein IJ521_00120 [Schwartzia sp.]|nr:hypothetical protein [Schwartzia sp. (in: firmicutes)]